MSALRSKKPAQKHSSGWETWIQSQSMTLHYSQCMLPFSKAFLFNLSLANYLHSRICGASAFSLNFLWNNYGNYGSLDGADLPLNGNNYTLYDREVPVNFIVQQAYMATRVSIAFAACLVAYMVLLCSLSAFYTARAHISVKSVKENGFSSCIDKERVDHMISAGGSNSEDAQLELAFSNDRVLYCRDAVLHHLVVSRLAFCLMGHLLPSQLPTISVVTCV